MIHAPNCKLLLPWFPSPFLLQIYIMLRKFQIKILLPLIICVIVVKKCYKSLPCLIHSFFQLFCNNFFFEIYKLFSRKMYCQLFNWWIFFIHRKFKYMPHSFCWSYRSSLKILRFFILIQIQLNSRTVRTFINIFVNIFNSLNWATNFDINMSTKMTGEVEIIWHNPIIIQCELLISILWMRNFMTRTVIALTIKKITIFLNCYLFKKLQK